MTFTKSGRRWIRNQHMTRRRRVQIRRTRTFLSLKAKTWASIIIIVLLCAIVEAPIVTFGKAQSIATSGLHLSKVWAMNRTFIMPKMAIEPERIRNTELIKTIFGKDAEQATKVFTCESGLRTMAMNEHNFDGFPDVGIAQIHVTDKSEFTIPEMQSPVANLYKAKALFDARGWQPWDSSKSCWGK